MKALTTAVDEGLHKVPGYHHKTVRYALAPGDALDVESGAVVKVTGEGEYNYTLIWREGRVLAEFMLDGRLVAQPIKPDPLPRRKRDAAGRGEGEDRGRDALPADRPPRSVSGGEPSRSVQADRTGAGAAKRRKLPDLL